MYISKATSKPAALRCCLLKAQKRLPNVLLANIPLANVLPTNVLLLLFFAPDSGSSPFYLALYNATKSKLRIYRDRDRLGKNWKDLNRFSCLSRSVRNYEKSDLDHDRRSMIADL